MVSGTERFFAPASDAYYPALSVGTEVGGDMPDVNDLSYVAVRVERCRGYSELALTSST